MIVMLLDNKCFGDWSFVIPSKYFFRISSLPSHVRESLLYEKPSGQTHSYEPLRFLQTPPLQIPGIVRHSSISGKQKHRLRLLGEVFKSERYCLQETISWSLWCLLTGTFFSCLVTWETTIAFTVEVTIDVTTFTISTNSCIVGTFIDI